MWTEYERAIAIAGAVVSKAHKHLEDPTTETRKDLEAAMKDYDEQILFLEGHSWYELEKTFTEIT